MADLVDRAQAREEEILADAMGEFRRRSAASAQSLMNCEDCGELIAAARRAAVPGCVRCVECQGFFEERQRRGETRT